MGPAAFPCILTDSVYDIDSIRVELPVQHVAQALALTPIAFVHYFLIVRERGWIAMGTYAGLAVCLPEHVNRQDFCHALEEFSLQPAGVNQGTNPRRPLFRHNGFVSSEVLQLALQQVGVERILVWGWGLKYIVGVANGVTPKPVLQASKFLMFDLLLQHGVRAELDVGLERRNVQSPDPLLMAFDIQDHDASETGLVLEQFGLYGKKYGGLRLTPALSFARQDEQHRSPDFDDLYGRPPALAPDRFVHVLLYSPFSHGLKRRITDRSTFRPQVLSDLTRVRDKVEELAITLDNPHAWSLGQGLRLELRVACKSVPQAIDLLVSTEQRVFSLPGLSALGITRRAWKEGVQRSLQQVHDANMLRGSRLSPVAGEDGELALFFLLNFVGFYSRHLRSRIKAQPTGDGDWFLPLPTLRHTVQYNRAQSLELMFVVKYVTMVMSSDKFNRPLYRPKTRNGRFATGAYPTLYEAAEQVLAKDAGKPWLCKYAHSAPAHLVGLSDRPKLFLFAQEEGL